MNLEVDPDEQKMRALVADALRYRALRSGKTRLGVWGGSFDESFEGDELDAELDLHIADEKSRV